VRAEVFEVLLEEVGLALGVVEDVAGARVVVGGERGLEGVVDEAHLLEEGGVVGDGAAALEELAGEEGVLGLVVEFGGGGLEALGDGHGGSDSTC
jgi:hypothetical protein